MNIVTIGAILTIATSNITFNPNQFILEGDTIRPNGRYQGNGIMQIDNTFYCMDAHNVDCEYFKGDCNNDGTVNIADLVTLDKFTKFGTELFTFGNADINLDTYVSPEDYTLLYNLIIKENDYE